MLRVDLQNSRLRDIALNQIPFELLSKNISVGKQTEVFPVGHPGGDEWYVPLTAAKVGKVIFEAEIQFEFSCSSGYSGGGLFSPDWQLAGMILRNHARYCEAISFKRIRATLEDDWELEVSRERIRTVSVETPIPTPSLSVAWTLQ